ncbi:hypothetical protein YC2023_066301 [Brassica napus]
MTSVGVRVCPCVSISTHRTSVAVHQLTYQHVGPWTQTLALPVDCLGDFGPRVLSVQYTQNVRGCPSAHTRHLCVCQHTPDVRGCLCVSVSTHRTSVTVLQYTYQHVDPWTQHADPSRGLLGTSGAVRVCPSAHTGHPGLCVCVCVCPSANTGRPWLSISTHISTLVVGHSTLTLPVDCSGDFGPRGLSGQYTQDVRGCPLAHT